MDFCLNGKVAMITGASRGIGAGIAAALAAEGCHLAVCARDKKNLENSVKNLEERGTKILALPLDITEEQSAEQFVARTLDTFGRLDVLVNNVGGNRRKLFEETTDADWQSIMDMNLNAHIKLSRAVIPLMKKQRAGSVIFISSIFGRESGGATLSIYNTTKAAMISLAKVMAVELAPHKIRVNSVAPGSIRFPGGSWDKRCIEKPDEMKEFIARELPLGRFGTVEEVGNLVAFLASEKASLITGTCINIDGGQSRSLI
jgi:3-oxoacyl-[acyl-carrier protein] reductase